MSSETIESLLKFDPIEAAERIAGREHPEVSLALSLAHNERKEKALRAASDSYHGIPFAEFFAIAELEGFTTIWRSSFLGDRGAFAPYDETFVVMWSKEGVLLQLESYAGTSINSARMTYNAGPATHEQLRSIASSGTFIELDGGIVLSGYHDVREGFRHNLHRLRAVGLMRRWVDRPFLWLLNYAEAKTSANEYKAITDAVVATFPEDVQRAVAEA